MSWLINVKSVDAAGAAVIDVNYKKMKMLSPNGNGDSESAGTSVMDRICKAIASTGFTMFANADGEITDVQGRRKNRSSRSFMPLPELSPDQRAPTRKAFSTQFSPRTIKEQMSITTNFYPVDPVDNGDTWKNPSRSLRRSP